MNNANPLDDKHEQRKELNRVLQLEEARARQIIALLDENKKLNLALKDLEHQLLMNASDAVITTSNVGDPRYDGSVFYSLAKRYWALKDAALPSGSVRRKAANMLIATLKWAARK